MKLENKIAVVTGAASGIGYGIVEKFVKEGAKVVVGDITDNIFELENTFGKSVKAVKVDVSKEADVKNLIETAVNTFGKLDILCNNAGIIGAYANIEEYTEEQWNRVLSININGPFFGIKHAVPFMKQNGGGSIINTVSISSRHATPGSPAYVTSKGAVLMLTRQAGHDYARDNIRVNGISPGVVNTGILKDVDDDMLSVYSQAIPMGRIGQPSELANVVCFLASDEASYVTGQTYIVDGGKDTI